MVDRNQFDLDDFGDLDDPSFADEGEFLPPDPGSSGGPRRNTTFLLIAVALVVLFLLGLAGIVIVIIGGQGAETARQTQVAAIELTNHFVETAVAATQTAKSWTATPTPTDT